MYRFCLLLLVLASCCKAEIVEYVRLDNGYSVWTKRVGHGPVQVLMLHGGPGFPSDYLEGGFSPFFAPDEFQLIYYDQLGSYHSEQPEDLSLWTVERFREEVEQVRKALQLDDFYLYGQSWGGMLAIEYALEYQEHLKGLILSNTPGSIASYEWYIRQLRSELSQEIQDRLQVYEENNEFLHPQYQELLFQHLYSKHVCRCQPWPESVLWSFENMNPAIYQEMQGPSEFTIIGNFKHWDRWGDFAKIQVPTLVISGRYDTINPEDTLKIAALLPQGEAKICEEGSHLALYDDATVYFETLHQFLKR